MDVLMNLDKDLTIIHSEAVLEVDSGEIYIYERGKLLLLIAKREMVDI